MNLLQFTPAKFFFSKISLLFLFFFSLSATSAQSYFQQEVNYSIQVKLDDIKNELNAFESIEYTNNSSNSLTEIYFHLWPNAYKNETTALAKQMLENGETNFYYSKPEERGYIHKLAFKVNGAPAKFSIDSVSIDIGKLILPIPLLPGNKITITTPFQVKIPSADYSRLGHLGQSYMISQWFPKPAVYDATGWHAMPYLTQGEFYSEFGSFDVLLTLPKNYVVGATGLLMDSAEVKWMNEKAIETSAIAEFDKDDSSFPNSDTATKTIHFVAKKVHDFAWFADKRFHVLNDEFEIPASKRKVQSWTLFTNSQPTFWKHGPEFIKESILKYSEWIGEYPYDQVTIVDGTVAAGTGMEYPMIAVIGNSLNLTDFEYTVVHEVGHNWFYGILANNERDNPWMDEGLNTYYNLRFFEEKYPSKSFVDSYFTGNYLRFAHLEKYSHKTQYVLAYLNTARKNKDQACTTPSVAFTDANYGNDLYFKTGFIFNYLAQYLGVSTFDTILQNYFENWKFKHPQPLDFITLFEDKSNKNLTWFFDDLLGSTKKLDYKIASLRRLDSAYVVTLKNRGSVSAPFTLTAIDKNKVLTTRWYEGFSGHKNILFPKGSYRYLAVDYPWDSPELYRTNNTIRTKGIFKKIEPFHLQFIGSIEKSERTTINYFPILGFNNYDKLMGGIALYNIALLEKRFEYLLLPLYAFGSKDFNGAAQFKFHWHPNGKIQAIEPLLTVNKFSYRDRPIVVGFAKLAVGIDFTFRKKNPRNYLNSKVKIRNTNIWEDQAPYSQTKKEYQKAAYQNQYSFTSITYEFSNKRVLNPFQISLQVEQGKAYIKSQLEAIFQISYKLKNKAAAIRIFGGKFLYENNAAALYGFAMSGNNDYAYDHIYLGRNDVEGVFNQQFYMKDAGFKNLTLTPNALNWMLACNLFIPAPGKIPFAFYSDIGKANSSTTLDYDWGIALVLWRNVLEIYAPVQQSSDLNQLKYAEKIRFVLHLNALNPIEQLKNYFN